jgi:type II secretory pathway pseudopilin PulG
MVELLVVVAIIAVLVALTTAAVFKVSAGGKRVTAVNEISQLDIVLTKFKQDHGFYPPSHISNPDGSIRRFMMPHRTDMAEFFLLKRMFPRWNPPTVNNDGVNIDLNNVPADYKLMVQATNVVVNSNAVPLDGHQCLVFFLGGIPVNGSPNGFDQNNPYAASLNASNKKGPYFEFQSGRLLQTTSIPRYADPWGVPYAYFSANAGSDNYDPRAQFPWPTDPAPNVGGPPPPALPSAITFPTGFTKEASEGSFIAHPYRGANGKWLNPGKVQIISAGEDQAFGAGSYRFGTGANDIRAWVPGAPGTEYISSGGVTVGYDDIANFNGGANLGETGNQ